MSRMLYDVYNVYGDLVLSGVSEAIAHAYVNNHKGCKVQIAGIVD